MLIYSKPDACKICAAELMPAFRGIEDKFYGVRGQWDLVRCSNDDCGAVFLDQDLTASELTSFYDGYATHSDPILSASGVKLLYWRALAHIWHRRLGYDTRQTGLARLMGELMGAVSYFRDVALARVFWLPSKKHGRVIEVGFGNGQGMWFLRKAGWDVLGIEFDDVSVRRAELAGFDVLKGNFADGIIEASSADAVVASHVIEHLPDPAAFMAEAFRVLRPGGLVVLRTPNGRSADAERFGANWRGWEVPRHLCVQNHRSLAKLAAASGFTKIRVFGTSLMGFAAQQSRKAALGKPVMRWQGTTTLLYDLREWIKSLRNSLSAGEVVLICSKPL